MRIESASNNDYSIFINSLYINDLAVNTKEEVGDFLKDLIVRLKNTYSITLKGFYEVEVYINRIIGMYIKMNKIKKFDFYMDEIDLKIDINFNSRVYYKTLDYFIISKYKGIKIKDGYYYISIDTIDNNDINSLVEHGTFDFN